MAFSRAEGLAGARLTGRLILTVLSCRDWAKNTAATAAPPNSHGRRSKRHAERTKFTGELRRLLDSAHLRRAIYVALADARPTCGQGDNREYKAAQEITGADLHVGADGVLQVLQV